MKIPPDLYQLNVPVTTHSFAKALMRMPDVPLLLANSGGWPVKVCILPHDPGIAIIFADVPTPEVLRELKQYMRQIGHVS